MKIKSRLKNIYRNFLKIMPTKFVLNIENLRGYHRFINFKKTEFFGEKIQYLKLYGKLEKYSDFVDKYKVRNYIKEKIGEDYLIPLLGIYNDPNEIDYNNLPNKFVIKLNTGSGYNIIVNDKEKVNKLKIKKQLIKWMKEDYYKIKKENQYKNIKKKILIEPYIEDSSGKLQDYKFYCFDGKIEFIEVDFDRFSKHTMNFYDNDWNLLEVNKGNYKNYEGVFSKPENYNDMKEVVAKIANDFQFVRIDFYNVDGKIYFGELTFTPAGGLTPFKPIKKDIEYAKKIRIESMSKKILYIGRISSERQILDGVTVKARILKEELERGKKQIKTIDVDNWNKRIFTIAFKIIFSYIKCDEIVICTSSRGASKILKFLKTINNKKKIYYFVSGGNLYKNIEKNLYPISIYKDIYKIYVESQFMKEKFWELGLNQTEIKYNFRNPKVEFDTIKETTETIKFVFWGRIIKEKGIVQAIELINRLYNENYNVELYIYGQGEKNFIDKLKIDKYNNIYYMGPIKPNGRTEYEILHQYDILIFPTEHEGEGLPGALIEAYISGLCIVASEWSYANEYIKNENNGIIFEYKNYIDMYEKVLKLINDRDTIDLYKGNSLKESKKYIIENVIPKELIGE